MGYTVVEKWKCDWDRELTTDTTLAEFVSPARDGRTAQPPWGFISWSYQWGQVVPQSGWNLGRADQVCGRDLLVPLGPQVRLLSRGTSADHHQTRRSEHPQQRTLRKTWSTPEVVKAVEMENAIIKIHEVCHFPENQRVEGLFAPYVNKWVKIKQESSG